MNDRGHNLCIEYRCICGEKVTVARFLSGPDIINEYPPAVTVSCSNGHVGTFTADQYAALESWSEGELLTNYPTGITHLVLDIIQLLQRRPRNGLENLHRQVLYG